MKSLRLQLLIGTALGTTVVLVACGMVLHGLIGRAIWAEFDEALAARARSLTALAEQDDDELEFELTELSLPEFKASQTAEYYQIWWPEDDVFARSPSLGDADLVRPSGSLEAPAFASVTLPDGRPGRVVGMTFEPRLDSGYFRQGDPITVTLVLGRDVAGLQATLGRVRSVMIGVCLVAVAVATGVLAWVVRRALRPADHLGRQIAGVGEDDLSTRIDPARIPVELQPIVDRLNDLLVRLESAFLRERRFTGDVAHELRTPLAGLRTKLELALSRERRPEAYRQTMLDCLEIDVQMHRMVENLLHLARADAGQLEVRFEPVDLPKLIRDCWQSLEGRANDRGLRIDWQISENGTLETDGEKLRLVLQNLLENAVSHADEGGRVSVAVATGDSVAVVTVSNTGGRISPDDVPQMFDRFWRADASHRAGSEHHCGLGLPLCKAIVDQLGGSIRATVDLAGAFEITVTLPAVA